MSTSDFQGLDDPVGFAMFLRSVRDLIRSHHAERAALRDAVVGRLGASRDPLNCIDELIDQCVARGGPDGLDIGIDVLSHFGDRVIQYAMIFSRDDSWRWDDRAITDAYHINDDKWYVIFRALSASQLGQGLKVKVIDRLATGGPTSVIEAAILALGDVGGEEAIRSIRHLADSNDSRIVKEAASEVLDDLGG